MTWALIWAVAGVSVGVISLAVPSVLTGTFFQTMDAPLPAMAVPGFFGGLFFAGVLGVAGRQRRFAELSFPRFTAWGAFGGVLLSLFPAVLTGLGLADPAPGVTSMSIFRVVALPFALLGAISAAATLAVARFAERRDAPAPAPLEQP